MIQDNDEPPCKRSCKENSPDNDMEKYIEVGIEEFLDRDGVGFSGKIKERWEDFIVNEVNLNKEVVHLTNLDLPSDNKTIDKVENKFLSDSIINDLENLLSTAEKKQISFDAPDDKFVRTEIYNFLKTNYPTLFGNTEMINNTRVFVITNYSDQRSQIAKKISKMSGDKEYCQFVLYKEGKDTISAIDLISKYLKIKPGNFTYAGTKDRRGITTQLVRVRSCAANRLKGLNKCLNGIVLGNFIYVDSPLKLGDLYGNRFRLVIREIKESDDEIRSAVERFKKGFVNYFGLQRFGSTEIRSHEIGKLAIASNWTEMIKLILEPTPQDLPFMRECKMKLKETNNYEEFLKTAANGIEKSIVFGLSKHGYTLNAIDMLPRNLRQLYVHSYQSYVWNKIVSKRIRECGSRRVLVGDLVEINEDVHVIEESEVDKYQIEDVVLPLPGYDVKLPKNEVADWYKEILAKDNLTMETLRHRVKDFSLPGSYRKIVVIPSEMEYFIKQYCDVSVPLIESDFAKLQNKTEPVTPEGPLKAAIMEFTLPKSAYATIAMRELMKSVKVIQ